MDEKKTSYAGISWELKISEKSLLGCGEGEGGGQKFLVWWGGLYCWGKVNFVGGDHVILK